MVLDCRPVNQLHRPPPKSRLATPGALSNINMSIQRAELSGDPFQSAEDLHYTEAVHSPVLVDLKTRAADLNTSHVVIAGIVCKFNIGMLLMAAEPSAPGS